MHPRSLFDENPYRSDKPPGPPKKEPTTLKDVKPFKPSSPAKAVRVRMHSTLIFNTLIHVVQHWQRQPLNYGSPKACFAYSCNCIDVVKNHTSIWTVVLHCIDDFILLNNFTQSYLCLQPGGSHVGTFDPYPTHSVDGYQRMKGRPVHVVNKTGKLFVPNPGPKSAPVSSIVNYNVVK